MSIRCDLDSDVTLDVVDETSEVDLVVEHPFFLIDQGVIDYLEEKNLAATSYYEGLLIDQEHCSQVFFIDFLEVVLFFSFISR